MMVSSSSIGNPLVPFRVITDNGLLVVLTTFGTVGNEYKKKARWLDEGKSGQPPGLFFIGDECKWYRVIIDEAQCIKNKDTQYARGCCAIDAEYRLCLSGTPMQNSCDE